MRTVSLFLLAVPIWSAEPVINSASFNTLTNQLTVAGSNLEASTVEPALTLDGNSVKITSFTDSKVVGLASASLPSGTYSVVLTNSAGSATFAVAVTLTPKVKTPPVPYYYTGVSVMSASPTAALNYALPLTGGIAFANTGATTIMLQACTVQKIVASLSAPGTTGTNVPYVTLGLQQNGQATSYASCQIPIGGAPMTCAIPTPIVISAGNTLDYVVTEPICVGCNANILSLAFECE
jgi:hypothetical protein